MEKKTHPEIRHSDGKFKINDIVTCPSDGTNFKWMITEINKHGYTAELLCGQQGMPKHYPKKINIQNNAANKWKLFN